MSQKLNGPFEHLSIAENHKDVFSNDNIILKTSKFFIIHLLRIECNAVFKCFYQNRKSMFIDYNIKLKVVKTH